MKTFFEKSFLHGIVFLLLLVSLDTVAQVKLTDPLPVSPEIKIGKLSNGLTYYIRKNSRPEKKVELRLVVKAGSILEDDDQQGLAHFTEHMAFNGSKHFKKNELVSFLQSIGVEFGADLNAYTSFDETVYILPIPLDKKENLDKGFLVLEDWASTVAFENTEIDKERGVVLEESRLGKGANDRMNKVIFPKLFEGSKYAERLPIGKEDILKNFKYDVIKRFYKDWYRPDLMAVVVVGDLDPLEAEKMIKAHFAKLKNPANPRPRTFAKINSRKTSEGLVVTDKEATNHILQILYSNKVAKPEVLISDYRDQIVKGLFNSMLGQRLQELTQSANPPFIYGGSDFGEFVHGYQVYSSFAVLSKAGAEPAITAVIQENERARKFGFTTNELDRTKKSMMRNMERAYNEREKSESENYADEYIRNFLEQEPIPGIENEYNYYKQFLEGISLEEVNQFAAKLIPSNENKLVILQGPEKADFTLPSNADLLALSARAENLPVVAYEENAIATSLMEKSPTAGKIISDTENKAVGYHLLTLGNGVSVILKPTDFKNDQVVMTATRFGGQSLYPDADKYNAQYAATLVQQMGVKDISPTDLRKVFAGKTVSASPRISTLSEGMSGQSGSADVEAMLQLTYLYFTQPRKDEGLFTSFVTKQQAMYQNLMSNPQAVFQDSIQVTMYSKHPRGPRVPKAEDFDKIDLDRSLEIYKERFGNANGFTFILVGSFDIDAVKPLVATYLGSLPSNAEVTKNFKDLGLRPVKGVVKKEVKKGTEPKSYISMAFTGEAPYSEEANLKLQALIEVLNIKLIESLREELSGIYGGGMRGGLNKNPYNSYSINVSLPCGPENVDKLIAATMVEIQKIKDNGPMEADLGKVKETWLTQYQEDVKDNSYWLSKLQQSVESGSSAGDVLTAEKRINGLTNKDIKEAANLYFNMKNYLQVVLYPEN
ncbi:MAG: insulinase family protein [Bacteroidia bacterium]|nr:insulinase family protein [Bacteroidia bacterium]